MSIFKKACLITLISLFAAIIVTGCDLPNNKNQGKGKYFVDSQYIIAYASLTMTDGETYGIDISHDSDIKLNYLKYRCDLYVGEKVIETFKGEVPMNGLYSRYIPLKTTNKYDHAKVVCTGYSDEDPKDFVRLNAMSAAQMKNCKHSNLITANVKSMRTNSKNDYLLIEYSSSTAFGDFRFFYDKYQSIGFKTLTVCVDCGYFSE